MTLVASRDLRNRTRDLLDRVEAGESITITIDGRPVATLNPVRARQRWIKKEDFLRRILGHQADPAMADDLAALSDETTDDLLLE